MHMDPIYFAPAKRMCVCYIDNDYDQLYKLNPNIIISLLLNRALERGGGIKNQQTPALSPKERKPHHYLEMSCIRDYIAHDNSFRFSQGYSVSGVLRRCVPFHVLVRRYKTPNKEKDEDLVIILLYCLINMALYKEMWVHKCVCEDKEFHAVL